jgi:hypothetical protein
VPQFPSTPSQPQGQQQQSSPSSQSSATAARTQAPVSATEQQWQARLNDLDTAFVDSLSTLTEIKTQMASFKSGITSNTYPTWNQMEALDQQVSRCIGRLNAARQTLPIGVAT